MGQNNSYLKIDKDDIGKFIVLQMKVSDTIGFFGTKLKVNNHKPDIVYCPMEIGIYEPFGTVDYKVNLKPIDFFKRVCHTRDWYISTIESLYDDDDKAYYTDNKEDAYNMAMKLNNELYPEK